MLLYNIVHVYYNSYRVVHHSILVSYPPWRMSLVCRKLLLSLASWYANIMCYVQAALAACIVLTAGIVACYAQRKHRHGLCPEVWCGLRHSEWHAQTYWVGLIRSNRYNSLGASVTDAATIIRSPAMLT